MAATATKRTRVLDDVLSFSQVGLELELYDWQLEADLAIDKGSQHQRIKIALVAPNGSGKTQRIVAVSALRWLNRYPRGRVIITSADSKQLDAQLMPAIEAHKHKFPGWEFLQRMVRTPLGGFLLAFTTDESARAEGHHATKDSPLLIIIDEAKSVEPEIFTAFDRCSYNVLLYISSPGLKQGRFYDAFTQHREQFLLTAQVGLTDCPHISRERIDDVIATYGADKPFTRSTLYGEFMDQEEGELMVFPFKHVMAALNNPPHARISRHEYAAFCDFAAGRDENVLAIRSGNKLLELVAWRERDTNAAVGRFIIEFRKYGLRAQQIWGDNGGVGHAMCDMLDAAGWPINRFDFGAHAHNEAVYVSRGAEIWDMLSMRVKKGEIVLINDPTLISQLTTRKFLYDPRGRIKLEPKDDMVSRGLKSPDRADAVIGAFAHGLQSFASYVKRLRDPWEKLDEAYEGMDRAGIGKGLAEGISRRDLEDLGAWPGD
jgi:phage terminase large subunit